MKKDISIFLLFVRTGIWKVLSVFGAIIVSQVLLFFVMGAGEEAYLPDAMEQIPSFVVVFIGLFLLSVVLAMPMSDRGGRMNNLILRLGLSEKRIFWIQAVFNGLVYCIFLMTQGMTMLLLCAIYDWITPGEMDPMAVFVTAYHNPLFHRFFPLYNPVGWISHLFLVTGLSICTAAYPMRQRHRLNSLCSTLMTSIAAVHYSGIIKGDHLYSTDVMLRIFVPFILTAICLSGVMGLEVDDDGKT